MLLDTRITTENFLSYRTQLLKKMLVYMMLDEANKLISRC